MRSKMLQRRKVKALTTALIVFVMLFNSAAPVWAADTPGSTGETEYAGEEYGNV